MLRLKQVREQRRLSQQQLAQRMGVAQNTLCNWENGKRRMDRETLLRLAQVLDVPVDYLMGGPAADPLSPQEKQLLKLFRSLPPDKQQELIRSIY